MLVSLKVKIHTKKKQPNNTVPSLSVGTIEISSEVSTLINPKLADWTVVSDIYRDSFKCI